MDMRFIKLQAASSESDNPVVSGMYDGRVYGILYEDQVVGFAGKTGPNNELEATIVMSSPAGLKADSDDKAFLILKNNNNVVLKFESESKNGQEEQHVRLFNVESISV